MTTTTVLDSAAIACLAEAICTGRDCTAAEARALLDVAPGSPEQAALFAGAQRIRAHFHGTQVKCCSILNVKAGNCSEDCGYCAQAKGVDNPDYDRHKWLPDEDIAAASTSARENGAQALGIVAAWRGVKEGAQLDMVVNGIKALAANGVVRPDASLGILESQTCADRIKEAGVAVYGHNLETARSFFDQTCSSHGFDERLQTLQYVRKAGMGVCSGGIIGMGESKDQRIEFAEQLRMVAPDMCPINFLNPLIGTGFQDRQPLDPDEALTTLAVFRFILPDRNLMVAGGKEITLKERLHEVFAAGANAVMVGNYLTTLGTAPDFWQDAARRYGLEMPLAMEQVGGKKAGGCGCH
jgi:biotin synthase